MHVTSIATYISICTYVRTYVLAHCKQCYLLSIKFISCVLLYFNCAVVACRPTLTHESTYLLLSLCVGCTALHLAAAHGKTSCVELLLRSGAVSLRKHMAHTIHTYTVHTYSTYIRIQYIQYIHRVHYIYSTYSSYSIYSTYSFFFSTFTIIRALGLNTSILYRIDKNVRVHDNKTISNNVLIISYYLEINMRLYIQYIQYIHIQYIQYI